MPFALEKIYNPREVETRWYKYWSERKYFHADPHAPGKPFVIVIPPPNVTGILTMGHVLNNTIQDILTRHARMKGFVTLWLPGTDHAGIATQNVVEKNLRAKGQTRHDLGRESFTQLVWDWALKHKSIILRQLQRLGCALDWERERFTLDKGLSRAVRRVFVELYHKGLIYRGQRIINWCPGSQTALSDEEVIHKEIQGHLWYFRYPFEEGSGHITVATTRPETMLGDTAVAVNPQDDRYRDYIGKTVRLPLAERLIPIIADDFVDRTFGTGAVKVTPAHDPNDYEIALRHHLPLLNILNPDATMNADAGTLVVGKDRFAARKIVVAEMERRGLLEKVQNYSHSVGFSQRADVMVEPYLSEQWFVRMKPLAEPALQVVLDKKIKFHPERWVKVYTHWMTNVRDWCISRQLWWGHRIPVFYCDTCGWSDALLEDPAGCPKCGAPVRQEADVLDTWFSSWLWPFSTLGWPEATPDLQKFYPTDDLVTAPDIIFFWVARMIMAGLEFRGDIPFKNVYFTGIIRDIQGRKMSKSLGNSPDPLQLIDQYGADALRFGVMLIAPQGQDILFSEERLEVGRNFMNKVWNAARFILMNLNQPELLERSVESVRESLDLADSWILHRLQLTIHAVDRNLKKYRFDEVARLIYDFIWSDFCDWYVELIKDRLYHKTPREKETALVVAVHVMRDFLKLLHPYAPFITEEIYQHLKGPAEPDIMVAPWPKAALNVGNEAALTTFALIQEVIVALRTARSEMNIPPATALKLVVRGASATPITALFQDSTALDYIRNLARVATVAITPDAVKPHSAATVVVQGVEIFIPLEGLIDVRSESERLAKEIARLTNFLKAASAKLTNAEFLHKAPRDIVRREREKETALKEQLNKLKSNLKTLAE